MKLRGKWTFISFLSLCAFLTACGRTEQNPAPEVESEVNSDPGTRLVRIENAPPCKNFRVENNPQGFNVFQKLLPGGSDPQTGEKNLFIRTQFNSANTTFASEKNPSMPSASTSFRAKAQRELVIAVIDSGVDIQHDDLNPFISFNESEVPDNGIDDDQNGYVDDYSGFNFQGDQSPSDPSDFFGHGTHVAGIALNSAHDIGVEEGGVKILPIRFMDGFGLGDLVGALNAIAYAIDREVNIINASWGTPATSALLAECVNHARALGISFVAAAGNEGINNDRYLTYPANSESTLAVASIDRDELLSSFSNFGSQKVEIAAPGEDILSTLPNNLQGEMSGTSMSAPMVSGVLAAIASTSLTPLNASAAEQVLLDGSLNASQLQGLVKNGRYLSKQQNLEDFLERKDFEQLKGELNKDSLTL
jgi:subtilisin family serine protease